MTTTVKTGMPARENVRNNPAAASTEHNPQNHLSPRDPTE